MKFALGKILDSFHTIANMLHQEEKYRISYLKYFVSCHSHLDFIYLRYDIKYQIFLLQTFDKGSG
jgi:hypothetical protein